MEIAWDCFRDELLCCSLHMHNEKLRLKLENCAGLISGNEEITFVENFGFQVPTCCGYIAMDNSWSDEWPVLLKSADKIGPEVK